MKQFKWPLERLLKVTVRREDALRAELHAISERLVEARRVLSRHIEIMQQSIEDLSRKELSKRLPDQLTFMGCWDQAKKELSRLEEQVAAIEKHKNERMAALLKTRQARQTLERLREEARNEYLRLQRAIEQKQLDEVAHIAFACVAAGEERNRPCPSNGKR